MAGFIKGISSYILGKFYLRLQRQYENKKIPKELQTKVKAAFKVIQLKQSQTNEFGF